MSKKHQTYGGVLKWKHKDHIIEQTRCINPPTKNAEFVDMIRASYPEYTLKELWKNEANQS